MGRGRQKAKQQKQKIARKLKYLTTDTDYDELAKELSAQEPGTGSVDPFSHEEVQYVHDVDDDADDAYDGEPPAPVDDDLDEYAKCDDDLDEYAKWAAEAAAKATSGEMPAVKAVPKPRPIPMPMPSALKPKPAAGK